MRRTRRRSFAGIVLTVVVVAAVGLYAAVEGRHRFAESYSGVVVDKVVEKRWRRGSPLQPRRERYYLVIRTDEGRTREVSVPKNVYSTARVDERVVKKSGRPYPQIDRAVQAPEAEATGGER